MSIPSGLGCDSISSRIRKETCTMDKNESFCLCLKVGIVSSESSSFVMAENGMYWYLVGTSSSRGSVCA